MKSQEDLTRVRGVHRPIVLSQQDRAAIREVRPFYFVVEVVLAGLYAYAVFSVPRLRTPAVLVLFSGLMALHGFLHWNSAWLPVRPAWSLPYVVVQGALATALVLVAGEFSLSIGLFSALVGEVLGVLREQRTKKLMTVAVYLALVASCYLFLSGGGEFSPSWLAMLPVTLFVVIYVAMFNRQSDARDRAQELLRDLECAHARLAEYATRVQDLTLAGERQRMARELHDTLAQGLAGLILQLEAVDAFLEEGSGDRAREVIRQGMADARRTLAASRRVIDDLRRGDDFEGMEESLRREVDRFTRATGIPCQVELEVPLGVLSSVRKQIGPIAAEALANVARHARAGRVQVTLTGQNEQLRLDIIDDGVGFEPGADAAASAAGAGHYGLVGMRERARLVGGCIEIRSAPGQGTALRVNLPMPKTTNALPESADPPPGRAERPAPRGVQAS